MQPGIQKVSPPFFLKRKASTLTSTWVSRNTKAEGFPFQGRGFVLGCNCCNKFVGGMVYNMPCLWNILHFSLLWGDIHHLCKAGSCTTRQQLSCGSSSTQASNLLFSLHLWLCHFSALVCHVPTNLLVVLSMDAATLHRNETWWPRHEFLLGSYWDISLWNTKEGNKLQTSE